MSRKNTAAATVIILAALGGVWLCIDRAPHSRAPAITPALNTSSRPKGENSTVNDVTVSNIASPLTVESQPAEVSAGALPEQEEVELKRSNFEAFLRYQKRLSQGTRPEINTNTIDRKIDAEERVKARLAAELDLEKRS